MRKKKKGSLSLSMNAIVILILAITLLGLGLSFMRGLFKQMEVKTQAAVSAQELSNPPTSDNPITTAPGTITLRESERGKILMAFMNMGPGTKYCQLNMEDGDGLDISPSGTSGIKNIVIFNAGISQMAQDQINTWTLSVDGSIPGTGTQIVTAKVCCDDTGADPVSCTSATNGGAEFKKDMMITVTT